MERLNFNKATELLKNSTDDLGNDTGIKMTQLMGCSGKKEADSQGISGHVK